MFTGIIEEIGTISRIERQRVSSRLTVRAHIVLSDLKEGDSVAVNGVCLTATRIDSRSFTADVMHETLDRSSLGGLGVGSPVNLERAMAANGRFGGHIVSGHIDATGTIRRIWKDGNAIWFTIAAGPEVLRYVVEKGSIAIDGVSLTVARREADSFSISMIPHTAEKTILPKKNTGSLVNLEADIIGKYVEQLMIEKEPEQTPSSGITREFLLRNGF